MELHDLAAAYVLGALAPSEMQEFESHLKKCRRCQAEVEELQGSTEVLFEAAYETPPDHLKGRVLESISEIAQPVRTARSWAMAPLLGWAAAAAVVILLVAVGLSGLLSGDPLSEILAASDAETIPVSATGSDPTEIAELELVFSPSLRQAVLTGSRLSPAADGMVYQMWLIGSDGPVPAGIFTPDDDGELSILVHGEPESGEVFGITLEPSGGSDQPTGEVLYSGEV